MRIADCAECGGRLRWVNITTRSHLGGSVELCADCFDKLKILEDKPRRRGYSSGPNHNDPGFDDAIRALEEDR